MRKTGVHAEISVFPPLSNAREDPLPQEFRTVRTAFISQMPYDKCLGITPSRLMRREREKSSIFCSDITRIPFRICPGPQGLRTLLPPLEIRRHKTPKIFLHSFSI